VIRAQTRWRACLILVASAAVAFAGCRKTREHTEDETDPQHYALFEIGYLLDLHANSKGKGAEKLADLKPYQDGYPNGFDALEKGTCVVVWGVDPRKKDANAVMAYQKEAPAQGGFVLMGNKKIKKMTADEFNAAYKPKG
jgi:hypothetical protein